MLGGGSGLAKGRQMDMGVRLAAEVRVCVVVVVVIHLTSCLCKWRRAWEQAAQSYRERGRGRESVREEGRPGLSARSREIVGVDHSAIAGCITYQLFGVLLLDPRQRHDMSILEQLGSIADRHDSNQHKPTVMQEKTHKLHTAILSTRRLRERKEEVTGARCIHT